MKEDGGREEVVRYQMRWKRVMLPMSSIELDSDDVLLRTTALAQSFVELVIENTDSIG